MPRFVDLFCGVGGFHQGLRGDDCVFACDIDPECRKTYETNYGVSPAGDIFTVSPHDIPDHDLLCAGFPCQPFSSAGRQRGFSDERSRVYQRLLDILQVKTPPIILLENVKNLTILQRGEIFQRILSDLRGYGYNVSYAILNASHSGVPQHRERVFIIGIHSKIYPGCLFSFERLVCPSTRPLTPMRHVFDPVVEDGDIGDIGDIGERSMYIDPNRYTLLEDRHIRTQKSGLRFCGYIHGKLREKGVLPNTEHLSRVHKQPNRIYHIDGIHPTLSASETAGRYYIYDGVGVRTLTVNECYRLMGFPKTFLIHDNRAVALHQIGNSVCPRVVTRIREELRRQHFL